MSTQVKKVKVVGFKKIKAVEICVEENDLTVIGGKNRQGKTSLLDGVAWCLGGDKLKPSNPVNDESEKTELNIILNDNSEVCRGGKNLSLSAKDSEGHKLTQAHINSKVGQFALNLPKFMDASPKEKADILLQCLGIGDKLKTADAEIERIYKEREDLGREKVSKEKHAAELPLYKDAPKERVSISELMAKHKDMLASNEANRQHHRDIEKAEQYAISCFNAVVALEEQLAAAEAKLAEAKQAHETMKSQVEPAVFDLSEIETAIASAEDVNAQVAANETKRQAQRVAEKYKADYDALTASLESARSARIALMNGVEMPIAGLDVHNGEMTYNGQQWDCMSDSERLKVAIAVARALNPECGFVIADRFEQMDQETQEEMRQWCKSEGFQIIASRVSSNPKDCTLIIEDGSVKQ